MGMSTGGGSRNSNLASSALAEINVTPLVDVMLVLLVIFMITSSAESFEMERQSVRLRQEQAELEATDMNQLVDIELPKTNSKAVNLSEEKKLVLSFTKDFNFHVGERAVLSCKDEVANWPSPLPADDKGDQAFRACIEPLVKKLLANEKLKEDGELYLRADKELRYGQVLILMAEVRQAGIHKFGLIAEEEP
jgi:biopolymer transport protein TolR